MNDKDNLPPLSHLQFAVLDVLGSAEMSGKALREGLRKERKIFKTGPGFYQMMSRLEDAGWVKGDYKQEVIDGQAIKERFYEMTGLGERAFRETARFYAASSMTEGRIIGAC